MMNHLLKLSVVGLFVSLAPKAFSQMNPMTINPLERVANRLQTRVGFPYSDEAMEASEKGLLTESMVRKLKQGSSEDYFQKMDYGITMPEHQADLQKLLNVYIPGITVKEAVERTARGRNNWIVWTGGNDRFWDYMARATLGSLDLIKTISNHSSIPYNRNSRWEKLGLVNEPCFEMSDKPNEKFWGLRIDARVNSKECQDDPFADASKYPGVPVGSRGQELMYQGKPKKLEVGSFYGYPTGVVGLRLFPNPDFDQAAANRWDPERYYTDETYYNDPNLVRPFRVGMSCAFCHVGPNPSRPPADFNNPRWENLTSNAGAQYFWVDRIFVWDYVKNKDSFVYQLLHTSRPGTLDTSLISSDQINNPRTMNAVYDLPARVALAAKMNHREILKNGEKNNAQFSFLAAEAVPTASPLRSLYNNQNDTILSPRILKDGSDSVGALGALNRVYVNIGLYSEYWIQNFTPLIGGLGLDGLSPFSITPFQIAVANKKSLYWQATVNQTPDLGLFFLAASRKDSLLEAPGGKAVLKGLDSEEIQLGKKVFAENCAACHSSKLPESVYSIFNKNSVNNTDCSGQNYMKCWNEFTQLIKTEPFKNEMKQIVMKDDFLEHNFLSNELRIPANVVDSQLCSPIAKNALKGNIWDNFSSTTYKELSTVGKFTVNFPYKTARQLFTESVNVPDGGRGFLRPASLISIWATAPFLQNNTVGPFNYKGTVEGRLSSFDESIRSLLNPEKRGKIYQPGEVVMNYKTTYGDTLPGVMDVTTEDSYLKIPRGYMSDELFNTIKAAGKILSKKFKKDHTEFFVKVTPVKSNGLVREVAGSVAAENDDMLMVGPIPKGTPINLISNLDLTSNPIQRTKAINKLLEAVVTIRTSHLSGAAATEKFMEIASESLLAISTCKDFVVNRGHYFGSKYGPSRKGLSEPEQNALIEYLKYF